MKQFANMLDFTDKVVVVTGGLGLIGKQVCLAFTEFNATVVVADMSGELFAESLGSYDHIHFIKMDISAPGEIESCIQDIIRDHKKIDAWINTAYPRTSDWGNPLDKIVPDSWNTNLEMHLGGYFWTSKWVLEAMKPMGKGSLINFGSIYGEVGPNFDIYEGTDMTVPAAYAAIKGAVSSLTRYLAIYYGPSNLRVNCIAPGGIFNEQDDQFVDRYNRLTPMKRMGKAAEMAMPAVFLASEAASYITGQVLMVDGGWTAQ